MNYEAFILQPEDDLKLTAFLEEIGISSSSVLGYHFPVYRNMLEKTGVGSPFYTGLRDEDGKLAAILPGFIKNEDAGTVYSSLPFFGPNAGVLIDTGHTEPELIHKALLDFLFDQLKQLPMISASLYTPFNHPESNSFYERTERTTLVVEKFTNYINLNGFKLTSSVEYDIRKAHKSGVTIRTDVKDEQDIHTIFEIYKKNCADYGIPIKPIECISDLLKASASSNNIGVYIAEIENKIIGALIMIYGPSVASYYLPCSIHEFRTYQPVTLLISHAIKESISRNIRIWNWESSPTKESGVYKFKKKWGSEDGQYRIYIYPFKDQHFFRQLGQENISKKYPYFFVYPFNQIQND